MVYLVADGGRIQRYVVGFARPDLREAFRDLLNRMGDRVGGWFLGVAPSIDYVRDDTWAGVGRGLSRLRWFQPRPATSSRIIATMFVARTERHATEQRSRMRVV
jgi:hypothetical protein